MYLIPDQVVVRVSFGDGDFGAAVFDQTVMGRRFELADMDDDSVLDIVAIEQDGPLRVLRGSGLGSFSSADLDPVGMDPRALAVGRLDGNGTLDAVVGTDVSSMMFPVTGTGDGTMVPLPPVITFGSVHAIALADFTGEGDLDVALTIQGG